jgi:hypothetical protein
MQNTVDCYKALQTLAKFGALRSSEARQDRSVQRVDKSFDRGTGQGGRKGGRKEGRERSCTSQNHISQQRPPNLSFLVFNLSHEPG